jgi:hypothetical protein
MTSAPRSVLAPSPVLIRASADLCLRSIEYLPSVLPLPVVAGCFHAGSRSRIFQPASSPAPYGTVSRKKLFNTQRLVPAPFNEFYPKCSGPTIPLHDTVLPPEHSR